MSYRPKLQNKDAYAQTFRGPTSFTFVGGSENIAPQETAPAEEEELCRLTEDGGRLSEVIALDFRAADI